MQLLQLSWLDDAPQILAGTSNTAILMCLSKSLLQMEWQQQAAQAQMQALQAAQQQQQSQQSQQPTIIMPQMPQMQQQQAPGPQTQNLAAQRGSGVFGCVELQKVWETSRAPQPQSLTAQQASVGCL